MTDIGPVVLEANDGTKAQFMPQSDITPLETALLLQMFIRMVTPTPLGSPIKDWPAFIAAHGLERHFVAI